MQLNRCPICHHRISLDSLAQDEAGRDLLALLSRIDIEIGTALVSYLSLFRSSKRDLANDRALRLAKEVMALSGDHARLNIALAETVEAIRSKPPGPPLRNHNYLKRVLESVASRPIITPSEGKPMAPTSKTGQALVRLEKMKQ